MWSMQDIWTEIKTIPQTSFEFGRLFPFVDRRRECEELLILVQNLFIWWKGNVVPEGSDLGADLQKAIGNELKLSSLIVT